jgi:hypothetical protein
MDYAKELAELGIVCKNEMPCYELHLYKNAAKHFDEAVMKNSDALLIPDRVERLNALEITSLYLDHAVKWKEKTWMELLRCTVGEDGIQKRKLQQELWEAQWVVWRNESFVCRNENCETCKEFDRRCCELETEITDEEELNKKWEQLCNEFDH